MIESVICRAKPKNPIFVNGQYSGHLIFYPNKQGLCFFEKKHFSFFRKKIFFLEIFFRKIFFKISKSFPPIKNLWFFFFFWEKKFPKKAFVFKKKKNIFFSKNTKFLFIGIKTFFLRKKTFFFCKKLSFCWAVCLQKWDFWFCSTDTIA